MKEAAVSPAPLRAMIGWSEGVSQRDAGDLARGFINRRFEAKDASWYAITPFMGGFLWEVHEGGPGKGYIAQVVEALAQDPGAQHWFPSGDRVFQVMMRDGKPFGVLLSRDDSKAVISSGVPPLKPASKMTRAVKRGTAMLVFGSSLFGGGATFFLSSLVFFALAANPGPQQRPVKLENLPHAQWPLVENTAVTEIVSKMEFEGGSWRTERRANVVQGVNAGEPGVAPEETAPSAETPAPTDGAAAPAGGGVPADATAPAGAMPAPVPASDVPPATDAAAPAPGSEQPGTDAAAQPPVAAGPTVAVSPELPSPVPPMVPAADLPVGAGAEPVADTVTAPTSADAAADGRSGRVVPPADATPAMPSVSTPAGPTAEIPAPQPLPWAEEKP